MIYFLLVGHKTLTQSMNQPLRQKTECLYVSDMLGPHIWSVGVCLCLSADTVHSHCHRLLLLLHWLCVAAVLLHLL